MASLVLHPTVAQALETYNQHPAHAVVLIGEAGAGKGSLQQQLAADLLSTSVDKLADHGHVLVINGDKHISIDEIRKIQHFLALKPADPSQPTRVILIEDAGRMTTEAQNALLKSIEEPPADSYLLLTASSVNQLLPTIMSRAQTLSVTKPEKAGLVQAFTDADYAGQDIERAYIMTNGLPGAMASLLEGDTDHPILQAAGIARQLLQNGKFERLTAIDVLAKDREAAIRVCAVLSQMAEISLKRDGNTTEQRERWQNVLATSLSAADKLRANAQAKLVLTSMSLTL